MIVFLKLNTFRKLITAVISLSQWNVFVVGIFWIVWRNMLSTHEAPDLLGLHKGKQYAFSLNSWNEAVVGFFRFRNYCGKELSYVILSYIVFCATLDKIKHCHENWKLMLAFSIYFIFHSYSVGRWTSVSSFNFICLFN